ncbi:MAG: CHRD domain-containing protein [Gemmatimonadaceae bacterium]
MKVYRLAPLAVVALAVVACNPFRREPAVEISAGEVAMTNRWNATLSTPNELAGAVQVRGTAWMAKNPGGSGTRVDVSLNNAAPGGAHPWHVHRGQCGADQGVLQPADAYKPLNVDSEGRAGSTAILPISVPMSGEYFVNVHASPSNLGTIVACGNLAAPTQ